MLDQFCKLKVLILFVIPMMMMGCQQREEQSVRTFADALIVEDADVSADTLNMEVMFQLQSEEVKDRVEGIFKIVKSDYMSSGGSSRGELLDRCYCSEAWNRLLLAVRCKEEETNSLFFDIDHWLMVRDPGTISYDEFVVTDITLGHEKRATVAYTVYGNDTYTPAMVDLVFEKGRWVIDNFHNLRYMKDVKKSMKEYLTAKLY